MQQITAINEVPIRANESDELIYRAKVETFLVALANLSNELGIALPELVSLQNDVSANSISANNAKDAANAALSSVYAARDIANAAKTDAINAFLNAQKAIEDSGLNYPQTAARQKADFFGLSFKL